MRNKITATLFTSAAMVLLSATAASAHVLIDPKTAEPGGYTKLTFRVPNEQTNTNTTQVEVDMPVDKPIASISVEPKAGWNYTTEKTKLATPVKTDDDEVTEAVSKIVWTANPNSAIKPDEFGEFSISAGPLPENVSSIAFKVLQTYSDGNVVRWIDTPTNGQVAEHPAPTLTLAATTDTAKKSDVNMATALGIVALVVGGAALALTIAAFLTKSVRK